MTIVDGGMTTPRFNSSLTTISPVERRSPSPE